MEHLAGLLFLWSQLTVRNNRKTEVHIPYDYFVRSIWNHTHFLYIFLFTWITSHNALFSFQLWLWILIPFCLLSILNSITHQLTECMWVLHLFLVSISWMFEYDNGVHIKKNNLWNIDAAANNNIINKYFELNFVVIGYCAAKFESAHSTVLNMWEVWCLFNFHLNWN